MRAANGSARALSRAPRHHASIAVAFDSPRGVPSGHMTQICAVEPLAFRRRRPDRLMRPSFLNWLIRGATELTGSRIRAAIS